MQSTKRSRFARTRNTDNVSTGLRQCQLVRPFIVMKMLAFRHDVRTASELGLWVALGGGQPELLAMLHLQPLSRRPLTWTFGALGGTRTPNLLIRSGFWLVC